MKRFSIVLGFLLLAALVARAATAEEIVLSEARFHLGDAPEGWMAPGFDDSEWQTMAIPFKWEGAGMYAQYRVSFQLPKGFVRNAAYKGTVLFDLAYIDDCDEAFLNGKRIGKSGLMPLDGKPQSAWDKHRIYKADARELREGENLLTLLVWNRRTRGGIYGGPLRIRMARLEDLVSISCSDDGNTDHCKISISSDISFKGTVMVDAFSQNVSVTPEKPFEREISYTGVEPVQISVSIKDRRSGQTVQRKFIPKYCLTPPAPAAPRYNGPSVLGARPGSPIYFRLPFSGLLPMQFSATGLPSGLALDAESGIVSGSVSEAGDYRIEWEAGNAEGIGKGSLLLKVGYTLALTPPMGWNSWNCWGLDISQEKVTASAQALLDSGLADYGYCYVNIDDAWQAATRDSDGTLLPNENFPDIAALGAWLHSQGLRLGIYSSPGARTCGGYLGSLGFEEKDAQTWNEWGVDYLKYDLCGYRAILDALPCVLQADHIRPYLKMEEYLRNQPRDIVYSLCQYGLGEVWTWGKLVDGNLWRTTGDITDTWESVRRIGFNSQRKLSAYAGPGHWNDPDMLVVGKVGWGEGLRDSRLSADEQYAHISLWALLSAPLMIGCDLSSLDKFTLNLLCNNEVIAVDQDPLGKQGTCLYEEEGLEIWGKPLADGSIAAGIFNSGENPVILRPATYLKKAGWAVEGPCRDLWRQRECPKETGIPPHGVLFLKFNAKQQ